MIPIEFFRQFRVGEYAVFDFVVAFLGIFILSPLLSKLFSKIKLNIPRKSWVYLTLPIGIISHLLAGSITPLTRDFIDIHSHYILKIIIFGLIFFGTKDIRIIRKSHQ